jgi:hypothetical protein
MDAPLPVVNDRSGIIVDVGAEFVQCARKLLEQPVAEAAPRRAAHTYYCRCECMSSMTNSAPAKTVDRRLAIQIIPNIILVDLVTSSRAGKVCDHKHGGVYDAVWSLWNVYRQAGIRRGRRLR